MRANRLTVSLIAEDLGLFALIWHEWKLRGTGNWSDLCLLYFCCFP